MNIYTVIDDCFLKIKTISFVSLKLLYIIDKTRVHTDVSHFLQVKINPSKPNLYLVTISEYPAALACSFAHIDYSHTKLNQGWASLDLPEETEMTSWLHLSHL